MKALAIILSIFASNILNAAEVACAPTTKEPLDKRTRDLVDNVLFKSLRDKDSRVVGLALVEGLKEKTKVPKPSKNAYDFYKDTEIQLAFSDKHFESIRRDCFKNQFQTNSSKGFASKSKRQKAETTLIGFNIDDDPKVLTNTNDKTHNIRPKYAYLIPTKPMEDVTPLSYSESYGNVYAVMKSSVKDRSTFTAQDSLKVIEQAIPLNTRADYKEIRKNKKDYWEAQIWGEVCFSDVAYFIVNCPEKIDNSNDTSKIKKYNQISDDAFTKMKETGIPVYQCKKEIKGVNIFFTKGETLSTENILKRKRDETKVKTQVSIP